MKDLVSWEPKSAAMSPQTQTKNKQPVCNFATWGARPPNLPFMEVFEERNWSLDFFRHVLYLLFECLSSLRSVYHECFLFIGMAELTSFGSFFFDQPRKETTNSRTPLKEDERSYPKKESKISWEGLLHREIRSKNGIQNESVMGTTKDMKCFVMTEKLYRFTSLSEYEFYAWSQVSTLND